MSRLFKTFTVMAMVAALAFSAMAASGAGGSADKATGEVTWTSAPGAQGLVTVFNAHEGKDGRPAKGEVTHYRGDSKVVVDIECVMIEGNEGWFAGKVTYGDGFYADLEGTYRTHYVKDVATPGADGDVIGINPGGTCADLGSFIGGGTVTDGNLQVHYNDSDA